MSDFEAIYAQSLVLSSNPIKERVLDNCSKIAEDYFTSISNVSLSYELCILNKLSPYKDTYSQLEKKFWKNANPFNHLPTVWDIKLAHDCYDFILTSDIKNIYLEKIIQIASGDFSFIFSNQKYALLHYKDTNDLCLVPIIVLEQKNILNIKIYITMKADKNEDALGVVEKMLLDIKNRGKFIIESTLFGFETIESMVELKDDRYIPLIVEKEQEKNIEDYEEYKLNFTKNKEVKEDSISEQNYEIINKGNSDSKAEILIESRISYEQNQLYHNFSNLNTYQTNQDSTKIYALYNSNSNSFDDIKISVIFSGFKKLKLQLNQNCTCLDGYIYKKTIKLYEGSIQSTTNHNNFQIKLKSDSYWKLFWGENIKYEPQKRFFSSPKYQFILNIKFDSSNAKDFDPYSELMFISIYLLANKIYDGLEDLVNQFKKVNPKTQFNIASQTEIVNNINEFLGGNKGDVEKLLVYGILCLLGILNVNAFECCRSDNLIKILNCLYENINEQLNEMKGFKEYDSAIKGLCNIFLVFSRRKEHQYHFIINSLEDKILGNCFIKHILAAIQNWNMSIDDLETEFYIEYARKLPSSYQGEILEMIVYCAENFSQSLNLLIKNDSLYFNQEKLKHFISKKLSNFNEDVHEINLCIIIIDYMKENYKTLFNQKELGKYLNKNLAEDKNIIIENAENYSRIIQVAQNSEIFKEFSIETAIQNFIKAHGFAKSSLLLQHQPEKIKDYFNNWLSQKKLTLNEIITRIDTELAQVKLLNQDHLCIVAIEYIINEHKSLSQIAQAIDSCTSTLLKEKFILKAQELLKKFGLHVEYANKLLDFYNENEANLTVKELLEICLKQCVPSEEDLMQNIIIKPIRDFYVFKYMEKASSKVECKIKNVLIEFINRKVKMIISKKITVNHYYNIYSYTDDELKIFIEYVKRYTNNETVKKLEKFIIETHAQFYFLLQDIENLTKLFTKYLSKIKDYELLNISFTDFKDTFYEKSLADAVIPANISNLQKLAKSLEKYLSSHIYFAYTQKDHEKYKLNPLHYMNESKNIMEKDMKTVLCNPSANLSPLREAIRYLNKDDVEEESLCLVEIVDDKAVKLESIKKLLNLLILENDLNALCMNLLMTYEILGINDVQSLKKCDDYIKNYNEYTIKKVEQELPGYEKIIFKMVLDGERDLVSKFFGKCASSIELLKFLNCLSQDEIDFLQDGLEEKIISNINLTVLVKEFANLWSFFTLLKEYNGNLSRFLSNLIEKLKQEKYLHTLEKIDICLENIKLLEDYNYEINNQEEAKIARIHKIWLLSKFSIYKQKKSKYNLS